MAFAPLNILLRQGAHILLRSLATPALVQCAVPGILLLIDGKLASPFWIQQILPLLRRFFIAHQLRVVTDGRVIDIDRGPVTVGLFELGDIVLSLGRPIRREHLGFDQSVNFADRHKIEVRAPRPRFGNDAVQRLFAAGSKDLAFDEWILLFKVIEQRLRLGHVGGRVPNQLAFLLRAFDELCLFIGLTPRRRRPHRKDRRPQTQRNHGS